MKENENEKDEEKIFENDDVEMKEKEFNDDKMDFDN